MNNQKIKQMKEYALLNNVPIIDDEGLEILLKLLNKYQPKSILELGTAIGYSAILMHYNTNATITSVDRELDMYEIAKENINQLKLEDQITLIYGDALKIDEKALGTFDCLYFDAAKAQNINFLNKYEANLNDGGVIILDNLLFHGWVNTPDEEIPSRKLRQLKRKINYFLDYVTNHPKYNFKLLEQGDGIGILTINKEYHG